MKQFNTYQCDFCHRNATGSVTDIDGEIYHTCDFCEEDFYTEISHIKTGEGHLESRNFGMELQI